MSTMKLIEIEPFLDVDKFRDEITEQGEDISKSMIRMASQTAWYGILKSKARKQLDTVKLEAKTVSARITKQVKKKAEDEGEKLTTKLLEAMVDDHPLSQAMAKREIEAKEIYDLTTIAYEAFETRRSMLTGLGNLRNAEMRSGINTQRAVERVNEHNERRNRLKDRLNRPSTNSSDDE